MRRHLQASLPGLDFKTKLSFGGARLKSHAKTARVVSTRVPMHLVLRSSKAVGKRSFLLHARQIETLIIELGRSLGVKVHALANAGNHLHLIVQPLSRRTLKSFLRSVTGLIARRVLKKERGSGTGGHDFWDARPYTRILSWGREYETVKAYLSLNSTEALGMKRISARRMFSEIRAFLKQRGLIAIGFDGALNQSLSAG